MKNYIAIRISRSIYDQMMRDLKRPHPYAYERVGFLFTQTIKTGKNSSIIISKEYIPVSDENYILDKTVGARINSNAIREAMQKSYDDKVGCFHVHLHPNWGTPYPSNIDNKNIPNVVQSMINISSKEIHGFIILSENSFYVNVASNTRKLVNVQSISVIDYPLMLCYPGSRNDISNEMFLRQSFLGEHSAINIRNTKIGIVGYGGGGSHIGQQLAHIGFKNITVFDGDHIEETNLNRLVGGYFRDIIKKRLKTDIAKRTIKNISPKAIVNCLSDRWQNNTDELIKCDIVVGCLDTYSERDQLEAECRRYLIPYIDIGMDVFVQNGESPYISGQVILSMPGRPCMKCMGFLTNEKLTQEAAMYGNIGARPQVVWPNGILASTAVGILVDLISGWTGHNNKNYYLAYDGNLGHISDHIRIKHMSNAICDHYPIEEAGIPKYHKL